jgi:3-oxoacyl-[acyl-carrier-protein] synthase-1
MSAHHVAICGAGLLTSVGQTAARSCAAFRAKVTNPTETRFIASSGDWIMAHQVELSHAWRGLPRLARMAGMVIAEALQDTDRRHWGDLPLLLCVAETGRPGRTAGLDRDLLLQIQSGLDVKFAVDSAIVPKGRVGIAVALAQARALIAKHTATRVLIAAVDSYLTWPTLSHYQRADRLLSAANPDGFMPGEAAGALLVQAPEGTHRELVCTGIGFGREAAHLQSDEPLRAAGLSSAIKKSLDEARREMHDIDFRITDNSGEQYYFKEASLALSRTMRQRKEEFDIWHPAECTGEIGACAGASILALALAACSKGYAKGPNILAHMSNDAGERAALTLQYRERT